MHPSSTSETPLPDNWRSTHLHEQLGDHRPIILNTRPLVVALAVGKRVDVEIDTMSGKCGGLYQPENPTRTEVAFPWIAISHCEGRSVISPNAGVRVLSPNDPIRTRFNFRINREVIGGADFIYQGDTRSTNVRVFFYDPSNADDPFLHQQLANLYKIDEFHFECSPIFYKGVVDAQRRLLEQGTRRFIEVSNDRVGARIQAATMLNGPAFCDAPRGPKASRFDVGPSLTTDPRLRAIDSSKQQTTNGASGPPGPRSVVPRTQPAEINVSTPQTSNTPSNSAGSSPPSYANSISPALVSSASDVKTSESEKHITPTTTATTQPTPSRLPPQKPKQSTPTSTKTPPTPPTTPATSSNRQQPIYSPQRDSNSGPSPKNGSPYQRFSPLASSVAHRSPSNFAAPAKRQHSPPSQESTKARMQPFRERPAIRQA
ncbi:hypothetical protein P7C70_g8839, partial [Phenoliferia sp. Uapishka_3]